MKVSPSMFVLLCVYLFSFTFTCWGQSSQKNLNSISSETSEGSNTSLTIYNSNYALVKERIDLNLKDGFNKMFYDGATMSLEPTSVVLTPIFGDEEDDYRYEEDDYKPKIIIAEQSYRNDVLSPSYMLSLFEGKTIDFLVESDSKFGQGNVVKGKVVRSGYQLGGGDAKGSIIEVDGKVRFGVPGVPLFPSLGDDTLLKPRLEWQVFSSEPFNGKAILSYLTSQLSWEASYNLVLAESGELADLTGLISISNTAGRDFSDASIQLMAGEVNRTSTSNSRAAYEKSAYGGSDSAMPRAVEQKAFDEYHLYTLPVPVTLRDRETKQVEFLTAKSVTVKTIYRYSGQRLYVGSGFYEDPDVTLSSPDNVSVLRRIENSKSNYLGAPLPAGTLRVYRKEGDFGTDLQFVGENVIGHTPEGEPVEVETGSSFDVLVKRVRTAYDVGNVQYLGKRTLTESFEFTLTNRKKEPVTVNIVEYLRGPNWAISSESSPHQKTSASEVQWDVILEADSKTTFSYTVEYKW